MVSVIDWLVMAPLEFKNQWKISIFNVTNQHSNFVDFFNVSKMLAKHEFVSIILGDGECEIHTEGMVSQIQTFILCLKIWVSFLCTIVFNRTLYH